MTAIATPPVFPLDLDRAARAVRKEAAAAPPGERQRLEALAGSIEAEARIQRQKAQY